MEIALQSKEICIANKPIDFRCGVDTLCAAIVENMQREPSKGIYIFYNKSLDRVKILGWHRNGFILVYKRLESGKFFVRNNGNNFQINSEQLNWLLIGVDWKLLSQVEYKNNAYF